MFEFDEQVPVQCQPSPSPRKVSTQTASSFPCDSQNSHKNWATLSHSDASDQFDDFVDVVGCSDNSQNTFPKFPCSECGSMITMAILDEHMGMCPNGDVGGGVEGEGEEEEGVGRGLQKGEELGERKQQSDLMTFEEQVDLGEVTNGIQVPEFADLLELGRQLQDPDREYPGMQLEEDMLDEEYMFEQLPEMPQDSDFPHLPEITINPGWMVAQPFSVPQPPQPLQQHLPTLDLPPIPQPPHPILGPQPPAYSIHIQLLQNDNGIMYIFSSQPLESFRTYVELFIDLLNSRRRKDSLTEAQIERIPRVAYNGQGKYSETCTVCQLEFEQGQRVMELPCGHIFGEECLKPWLENSVSCPNCRAVVKLPAEEEPADN